MKKVVYLICFLLCFGGISAQDDQRLVIIQTTGNTVKELPEMIILADSSALVKSVKESVNNSFIKEALELYYLTQVYLKNTGQIKKIEPAYLALTENQGGFAKFGFALKNGKKHRIKKNAGYVDITVDRATGKMNRLMSFTQLYPHELGHIFFHLLSPEDTAASNTKNIDMHFFSVVTDYSTAFNEGFAEHIENVSRHYEKNDSIKAGIFADVAKIEASSAHSIEGFRRDFNYPFRLGFYKASMLNWYQKYEDYKRYQHVMNGDIRYQNTTLELSNSEDQLTYRNAGVGLNENQPRNLVQLHATEGIVSSFFTHLSTSSLVNRYEGISFYKDFIVDQDTSQSPEELFTPLQNQFIKYFWVMNKFITFNNSTTSQLCDFIDGYIQTFPEEEGEVKKIYKEVTGLNYSNKIPPPLWLVVQDYSHRLVVFDPFGGITIPIYTFDLNAAEVEDLVTIDGVSKIDAEHIVNHRNKNGFYTSFNQLKKVSNLSDQARLKILEANMVGVNLEELVEDFNIELSVAALIKAPIIYVYSRASIYFLVVFFGMLFLFRRREKLNTKKVIWLLIKYYLLMVFLVLVALALVFMFGSGMIYFMGFAIVIASLTLLYRKNKTKRYRTLFFVGVMSLLMLVSMI